MSFKVALSDKVIKTYISKRAIFEIRDQSLPLIFRFRADRTKGSWYGLIFKNGETHYRKIGNWPIVSTSAIKKALPDILVKLQVNLHDSTATAVHYTMVDKLLVWHLERTEKNPKKKPQTKKNTANAINNHLLPIFKDVKIKDLHHSFIDTFFYMPMLASHEPATIKQIFSVLKSAFKQANELRLINSNPLSEMLFKDFCKEKILPKDSSLSTVDVPMLLRSIQGDITFVKMLTATMLMHGTRIGETRMMKWRYFDMTNNIMTLPSAITKTSQELSLPITKRFKRMLKEYKTYQIRTVGKSEYLFPTQRSDYISESAANVMVQQISKRKYTAHDLRKLARTIWLDSGVDYIIGEMLLNHALSKLDETYIKTHAFEKKRQALEKYHTYLFSKDLKK